MNVLLVYAHPEPRSLNGSLRDFSVKRLEDAGHVVQVSDLYAMKWKASLDAHDSTDGQTDMPFDPSLDSKHAFENNLQTKDIALEQDKLVWADPERLGGARLCVRLRLWRRGTLRRPLGGPLRGRHDGRKASNADCHCGRMGASLRPTGYQWPNR
jgi:hypothetical protein